MMVQKRSLNLDITGHTSHADYNRTISAKISTICKDTNLDDLGKFEELQSLIKNTKEKLKTEVLLGNKNVNDIIDF